MQSHAPSRCDGLGAYESGGVLVRACTSGALQEQSMEGRSLDNDAVAVRMTHERVRDGQSATPSRLNTVAGHAYIIPCRTPNPDRGEFGLSVRGEDVDGNAACGFFGGDKRNGNTVAQQP
jgi:hypothetical protein